MATQGNDLPPSFSLHPAGTSRIGKGLDALAPLCVGTPCSLFLQSSRLRHQVLSYSFSKCHRLSEASVLPGRARGPPLSTARGTASLFGKSQPSPAQRLPFTPLSTPTTGGVAACGAQETEHFQGRLCFFQFTFPL